MPGRPLLVRKAAVLGAGVMGAQIAAHLVNCDIPVLLFDLPSSGGERSATAQRAIDGLRRLQPAPLTTPGRAAFIQAANYDEHLPWLAECDLVIEAISERLDWKTALYAKVAPHLAERVVFATNTSGLSVEQLAAACPQSLQHRFCGVHFFNPPRYMHLVELIPAARTEPELLDALEAFLVTRLGKGVVRAKDTPNFIANRVGVFSMLATVHHAERLGIGFDTVDALTGTVIGRAKSATFRTADVVGLDTFAHVVGTMREALPNDPWHPFYALPACFEKLIQEGALGQKTRRGVYQKVGDTIQVLDPATGKYRESSAAADERILEILKKPDAAARFDALRASDHPQAQFLWSIYRDTWHYCAVHLPEIAYNARDIDFAIRWGFGWDRGPLEIWQLAGWQTIAHAISADIAAGRSMAAVPLPAWVTDGGRTAVHTAGGSYSPVANAYQPRSALPVYRRQPFPAALVGETRTYGETVFENGSLRCWHTGDDIVVLSFTSRMHAIDSEILDGVLKAIEEVERRWMGLVIWQTEPPFSVGANLKKAGSGGRSSQQEPSVFSRFLRKVRREVESLALKAARRLGVEDRLMAGRLAEIEHLLEQFQAATQALKFSSVPTVAAVDGLALGGGCEFIMHCDRAVATLESYVGLVEAGVGLLPGGGGCKEIAIRAAADAKGADVGPHIGRYFKTVAMAEVARSAEQAREFGFLTPADTIIANPYELLHAAKAQVRALAESGYRAPLRQRAIPVAGRSAIATLHAHMTNMRAGEQISEHDYLVGSKIAEVLCGGEVEAGSLVDEQWLLDLERRNFMSLIATEKTQARIEHTMKTGKPLRN